MNRMSDDLSGDVAARYRRLEMSHWLPDTSRDLFPGTLGDALRAAAAEMPDRPALVEGLADPAEGRRWTYAELLAESERTAAALLARFRPGEKIAVWAANVPEWVLLLYGAALAGIVLVTVNPAYKRAEAEYVLSRSDAAGLFVMDAYRGYDMLAAVGEMRDALPALREVVRIADFGDFLAGAGDAPLPVVAPSDPCIIMFTSGTTGAQKGVLFHHTGITNMAFFTQERGGLVPGGVFVNPMPMFHVGALGHAAVGAVVRRATHVLVSHWDPVLYMALIEREGGTYALLVPTMIETLLSHPDRARFDLSSFRNIVSGASHVEADLIRRTRDDLGAAICNIYGQTEMQGVVSAVCRDDTAPDQSGTIGQPLPHVEAGIFDPATDRILPVGQEGEIRTRGYQSMIGYYNMPKETAATLRPDGWLCSGDLGRMDERGFLRITGRIKDMIIRGGENIYPREIETLLLQDPRIAAVAVVGVPDPKWGEQVGAVIVPAEGATAPEAAELHALCRGALAHYKTPRFWYFVGELPMTDTGKVQKFRLQQAIRDGSLTADALT